MENKPVISSLGGFLKYPTLRDHHLHSWQQWLEGKRADDGAENLWRIHDDLYDFSQFVEQHPGGSDWLDLTIGTDITEAFESHHISTLPEEILSKWHVRKAKTPRNSPFTFEMDGFYQVLKERVREELQTLPKAPVDRSKLIADGLLIGFMASACLAVIFRSYLCGIVSGISLSMMTIAAHNFFHQKDNFRMYYFDFSMLSSRGWRVSHALSHHLYTNTLYDLEISSLEPWFQYLPTKKHLFFRYLSWFYTPIVYLLLFFVYYGKMMVQCFLDNGKSFQLVNLLPLSVFLLMWTVSSNFFQSIIMFVVIQMIASLHFGVVGVNAAHHHPDIFHDGDEPRERNKLDWGIHQLDAVMDRKDITGSHFLVITNFGDHALHHLFPTLDHGVLEFLYPVFLKTCDEFGIQWRLTTQLELVKGQFKQLARVDVNKIAPKYNKIT